ncbi:MAG: HlyD family type I secretion periplasmic adaptor subunit [Rhodobacterales bacterium]|nr:HlyD family type I secretion periplasmic adaptor subunit [Rhodobacterales bacterium]
MSPDDRQVAPAGAPPPPPSAPAEPVKIRRGGRQARYLAHSVILEEAGSSGLIRLAMFTISMVVVAFLVWASLTQVDEVAGTFGEVVPTGRVQMVQHLEGGIISDLLVEDGDIVDAGQVLIKLEAAGAQAELEQMKAKQAGLMLKAERLRAFASDREPDFSVAGLEYRDLAEDQRSIYEVQVSGRDNRAQVLKDQVAQRSAEIRSINEREGTLRKQLKLLDEQLQVREKLYKKGLSSKILYLDAQRQVNQTQGDINNLSAERQRTNKALAEAKSRLAELDTNLRETALAEMGGVSTELAQVRETMTKLQDRVRRLEIRAPVRGIIKGLAAHTVGGVIGPGGLLLEIVPLDKELIVETRINTRDVGHITVGQPVTVKVVTYDYARYGGISGVLEEISASTYVDEQGAPFYKGVVSLDRAYVGYDPEKNRLLPGMTVQADINTGTKTLLQYLLKPVYSSINAAFRER